MMKWLLAIIAPVLAGLLLMATFGALQPDSYTVTRRARYQKTPQAAYAAIAAHQPPLAWVETAPPLRSAAQIEPGVIWTFDIAPIPGGGALVQITARGRTPNPIARAIHRYVTGHGRPLEQFLADLARGFNEPLRMDPVTPTPAAPGRGRR